MFFKLPLSVAVITISFEHFVFLYFSTVYLLNNYEYLFIAFYFLSIW